MTTATSDLLNIVLLASAAPLASIACMALWRLRAWLGKKDTAQDKANMEAEVQAAIGAGIAEVSKVAPQIIADGITTPQARADVVDAAATYFRQRFPDRTAQISAAADNGTRGPDVHAAVQQTLAARLTNVMPLTALVADPGAALQPVVGSPATTLAAPGAGPALPP